MPFNSVKPLCTSSAQIAFESSYANVRMSTGADSLHMQGRRWVVLYSVLILLQKIVGQLGGSVPGLSLQVAA